MRSAFARLLPGSWSVYYAQTVIVLINVRSPGYRAETAYQEVSGYLARKQLQGCVSDPFDNRYSIREHYACTQFALETARRLNISAPLFYYEDFKLLRTLELLSTEKILFLCSAPVWKIYKEDHLNHTNHLETLFAYLHNGRACKAPPTPCSSIATPWPTGSKSLVKNITSTSGMNIGTCTITSPA